MIQWECKSFDELTNEELYKILQLRMEVFVVEQNCVFQDCDDKDQQSFHLSGWQQNKLVAYSRLVPPGLIYEEASIGRVITSPSVRGSNIGRELMKRSIAELYKLFNETPIKIGAQLYLKKFYESFGFVSCSDIYDEDGIDHIKMKLN
jgi:ElaA protein